MSGGRRLFFALWPEAPVRAELAQAARHWSSRPVRDANLHMTLVFVGDCDAGRTQCVAQAAGAVDGGPFELQLDYLGGWPRSRIQWLGCARAPAALLALVAALNNAPEPCGHRPEARRFVPHVTLSRHARRPRIQAGLAPVRWPVSRFALVESVRIDGAVCYDVLASWPLV